MISQLSENGEISNTTWNEIERYLTDSCKNINESYEFVNEVKCINFIQSALDRIAYNYTNNTYLPKPLRCWLFYYVMKINIFHVERSVLSYSTGAGLM